jgi:TetR/AcrR family transcriptional regulator, repressor of fatR-cypB operon
LHHQYGSRRRRPVGDPRIFVLDIRQDFPEIVTVRSYDDRLVCFVVFQSLHEYPITMNPVKITQVLSRKEREKIARQREILAAARHLFNLKGYYNTTLEEIAQQAEFGKGTIYNYFPSKEALFYGIIDQLAAETLEIAQSSMESSKGSARELFSAYAKAMISHVRANSDLFHMIFQEIHRLDSEEYDARVKQLRARARKIWEIIARPLEEEIRAGKIISADPINLVELFDSMVRLYCFNQYGRSRSNTSNEIYNAVEFIVSIFFDGIAVRKRKG